MATSGTIEKKFHGGSTGGYYFGIDWKVNSQSTANNSSNVTASVFIRTTGNGYTISSSATKNITLTINGTSYSGTATVGVGANTKKTLLTKTIDVKHNSDGTKTCAFACSGVLGLTLSGKYYGTVSHSGSGVFNTINLNTAPWWTSDNTRIKWNGGEIASAVIIPENVSTIQVISSSATDTQSGSNVNYELHRYINNSYSAKIKSSGSGLTADDNLSSWGQGTQIKYEARVNDGSLYASDSRWSPVYTKNTFTRASVTSIGSIGVGSTGVSFTATGIRNSGGGNGYVNTSFGYRIESLTTGVNIYGTNTTYQDNQNNLVFTLGIKNNGGSPTNPHWIDANELKTVFKSSNYKGTLKLRLVSWNSYGSQGYYDFNVSVDLRQNPAYVTITYDNKNKITLNNTDYYVPAHLPFKCSWNAINDPVGGEPCSYEVMYQIGTGSYVSLGTTSSNTFTAYLGTTAIGNNKTTDFRIIVRAITKYGYYSDSGGARITLWDYAPPTVKVSTVTRNSTNVVLNGTITINTTIPNVALSNTHWRWIGGSNTNFNVTNSSTSTIKNFTITASAAQDLTGTIHVASSDIARDLLANIVTMGWGNTEVAINGYMPVMSLTKEGVGINTRPFSGYKFSVEGNTKINGNLATNGLTLSNLTVNGTTNLKATVLNGDITMKSPNGTWTGEFIKRYEGDQYGMGIAIQSGGTTIIGGGESATNYMTTISNPGSENLYCTSDGFIKFVSGCQDMATKREITYDANGLLMINMGSVNADAGIRIVSTAGVQGALWSGTGGTVFQSIGDYNLHLGRNGSTTDLIIKPDAIEASKVIRGKNTIEANFTPVTNVSQFRAVTSGDGNAQGDGNTHIGYKDSNGNFHHYFRGKGAFNVNLSNGAYISVQVRTPKVITDRGTYSLLNNTTAYKTTSSEESFNEPNDNEIIDFIKNNSKIIPSEIRTLNDEANVIDYLTVAIDENIYVSESNKVEALWKAVNYLLNKIENLGGNNVQ